MAQCATLHTLAKSPQLEDLRSSVKLEYKELPPLAEGRVRIKVHFSALNFADTLIVQGKYQEKTVLPLGLGGECSGIVVESKTSIKVGSAVLALCSGAFASSVDAEPGRVWVLGGAFPLDLAAGFAVAAGTAHIGLVDRGQVKKGDTVVVTGASGGTGMYACLIAKALGCRVVATARGAAKAEIVRSLLGPGDEV